MNELHILDAGTGGDTIHCRQYDDATEWLVEVAGHSPRLSKQLHATGATVAGARNSDSVLCHATTEQLIMFLASATGYRCKLQRKVKRQYSEATKAAMRERLSKMNPTRNAVFTGFATQEQEFLHDEA